MDVHNAFNFIMNNHFSKIIIFYRYLGSNFPICWMILSVPIPIIFLIGFLTWGSHSHFLQVWYTTRNSFGWNIVRLNTSLCFPPYYSNPPYLPLLHITYETQPTICISYETHTNNMHWQEGGIYSLLHLSFISSKMIILLFSMQWHMLRLACFSLLAL